MPRLSKLLTTGACLYLFSHDLVWGCRHYARVAKEAQSDFEVSLANTSSVLMAASVLEAKLNELSAQVTALSPEEPRAPLAFWKVLHDVRKDMKFKDKWNLIASVSGGEVWDASREPFQSYELITSVRNELVHYKSEYGEGGKPPVRKIEALIQRFKGAGFVFTFEPTDASWVSTLLTARELAEWVAEVVEEFDMKFDHLLTGAAFTDQDRWLYERQKATGNPFIRNAL